MSLLSRRDMHTHSHSLLEVFPRDNGRDEQAAEQASAALAREAPVPLRPCLLEGSTFLLGKPSLPGQTSERVNLASPDMAMPPASDRSNAKRSDKSLAIYVVYFFGLIFLSLPKEMPGIIRTCKQIFILLHPFCVVILFFASFFA